MDPFLKAEDLAFDRSGQAVINGVSFSLRTGERLAVMGASGSGKTTLLRLIAGLERPTRGVLTRTENLRIGMVFQDLALWPNLSVLENVKLALPHLSRSARFEVAAQSLHSFQVAELSARKPDTLSMGQQQRVALARALACHPHLLLLDEPFSSLDWLLKSELLTLVEAQTQSSTTAVILVTHDLSEARRLCPQVLTLEDGKIADIGSWENVLAAPRSSLLRASLGSRW